MTGDVQGTLAIGSGEVAESQDGAPDASPVITNGANQSFNIVIDGQPYSLNDAWNLLNKARGRRVASVPRRAGTYKVTVDGEDYECVSVTETLKAVGKPQLVTWGARTAAGLVLEDPFTYHTPDAAASGIYKVRDRAGVRGATIHSLIEAVMEGAPIDLDALPPAIRGYGRAFRDWHQTHQPRHMISEVLVVNLTYLYAGTADLVAVLLDDIVWLIDFKTSAGFYPEHALQLAAYANAELIRPKGTQGFHPLPGIQKTGIVLLAEDGTWAMKEMAAPFEVYLNVLGVWRWLNAA